MGTFGSSLRWTSCSRSSLSSFKDDFDVMLKTRRKPWPDFMYNSLSSEALVGRVLSRKMTEGHVPHRSYANVSFASLDVIRCHCLTELLGTRRIKNLKHNLSSLCDA